MDIEERDKLLLQINKNIIELRTVVLGTNGFRGMQGMMEEMRAELDETKEVVQRITNKLNLYQTIDRCEEIHNIIKEEDEKRDIREEEEKKERIEKRERRKMSVREWVMVVITALGVLSGIIATLMK